MASRWMNPSLSSKHGNQFDLLLKDYSIQVMDIIKKADEIPGEEKKETNKNYVDGLLKNGGTSTDMFVKKIGKEKTEELFRKYVFFVTEA